MITQLELLQGFILFSLLVLIIVEWRLKLQLKMQQQWENQELSFYRSRWRARFRQQPSKEESDRKTNDWFLIVSSLSVIYGIVQWYFSLFK